jgi:hypothetical protein
VLGASQPRHDNVSGRRRSPDRCRSLFRFLAASGFVVAGETIDHRASLSHIGAASYRPDSRETSPMSSRNLAGLVIVAAMLGLVPTHLFAADAATASRRPNIVLIITDDKYGETVPETLSVQANACF